MAASSSRDGAIEAGREEGALSGGGALPHSLERRLKPPMPEASFPKPPTSPLELPVGLLLVPPNLSVAGSWSDVSVLQPHVPASPAAAAVGASAVEETNEAGREEEAEPTARLAEPGLSPALCSVASCATPEVLLPASASSANSSSKELTRGSSSPIALRSLNASPLGIVSFCCCSSSSASAVAADAAFSAPPSPIPSPACPSPTCSVVGGLLESVPRSAVAVATTSLS